MATSYSENNEVWIGLAPNTPTWYSPQSPSSEDLNHKEEVYSVLSLHLAYQNSRKDRTQSKLNKLLTYINKSAPLTMTWLPFKFMNLDFAPVFIICCDRLLSLYTRKFPMSKISTHLITPLETEFFGILQNRLGFVVQAYK